MGSRRGGRRRKRAAARPGQGTQPLLRRYARTLIGVGIAAVLVAIVGASYLSAQRGGLKFDFGFDVYQGGNVLGGAYVKLSDVAGQGQPVVLNFWAGNCPPCRFEMPALQRSYEINGDRVLFLGIDVGVFTGLGSRESAIALLNELSITYPAGTPRDRGSVDDYRVRSMPTTVFLDADGQVFRRWEGTIGESQLNGIVEEMLQ